MGFQVRLILPSGDVGVLGCVSREGATGIRWVEARGAGTQDREKLMGASGSLILTNGQHDGQRDTFSDTRTVLGTAARVLDRSPRHSDLMSHRLVERRTFTYKFIYVILKDKTSEVGSEPQLYVGRGHGRDFGIS